MWLELYPRDPVSQQSQSLITNSPSRYRLTSDIVSYRGISIIILYSAYPSPRVYKDRGKSEVSKRVGVKVPQVPRYPTEALPVCKERCICSASIQIAFTVVR